MQWNWQSRRNEMLVAERHREIVAVVNKRGSIRVTELAQLFHVTEETIRRDLEKLESQGKLQQSHGGAVRTESTERETPFSEREIAHVKEKSAIAREAVKRVEESELHYTGCQYDCLANGAITPEHSPYSRHKRD